MCLLLCYCALFVGVPRRLLIVVCCPSFFCGSVLVVVCCRVLLVGVHGLPFFCFDVCFCMLFMVFC